MDESAYKALQRLNSMTPDNEDDQKQNDWIRSTLQSFMLMYKDDDRVSLTTFNYTNFGGVVFYYHYETNGMTHNVEFLRLIRSRAPFTNELSYEMNYYKTFTIGGWTHNIESSQPVKMEYNEDKIPHLVKTAIGRIEKVRKKEKIRKKRYAIRNICKEHVDD